MSAVRFHIANYKLLIAIIFNLQFIIWNSVSAQFTHTALVANAGSSISICPWTTIKIGGNPSATGGIQPYTYSWQSTFGLDSANIANPKATIGSTTNFTLTVTDSLGNSSLDSITVFTYPLPPVNAGPDQTINEGQSTILNASGAIQYYWTPTQTLTNQNTATPTAEPGSTTTYCVGGTDNQGCSNTDCMTVKVIPSDTLIFYNAFSPNNDGDNDVFYIGNLEAFPEIKLEVYNRNGKLVYQASPYHNDWNGKIDGAELPCATYYFIVYPGKGKPNREGAVTIIR